MRAPSRSSSADSCALVSLPAATAWSSRAWAAFRIVCSRPVSDWLFAARYLGVTPNALRADLRSGATLAQVAGQSGKTAAELEQAIESAASARLAKAVSAGLITAQREQTMLANLQARLDTLVNRSL